MLRRTEGDVMYLTLEEDLVASNVKTFKAEIHDYVGGVEIDEIVLNMSRCENIDSVGVTFVVSLYKLITEEAKSFRVTGSSDEIKQLFKLMKLDEFFDLDD